MDRREFLAKAGSGVVTSSWLMASSTLGLKASENALPKGAGRVKVVEKGVVYDKSPAIISGVCRCKSGDLLVAYNTAGDLRPGERSGIVRSTDGGRTWSDRPETEFESVFKNGGIEAGCSLTCLSNGRLLLPYSDGIYLHPVHLVNGEFKEKLDWVTPISDGHGHTWRNTDRIQLLFCPVSDDQGHTWHNRKAQSYDGLQAAAYGKVVELPSGKLLLPLFGARDRHDTLASGVVQSSDNGETWSDYRCIRPAEGNETFIILLPDGRVLALLRGDTPQDPTRPFHVAYSGDGGETWTAPQKVNMTGTSPALHLTPKGLLLAGYRSTAVGRPLKEGRCHISSSLDNGQTWDFELELELPRGQWSAGGYPSFTNLPDGRIFVTFHYGPTRLTWFTADNILAEQ